MSHYYDDRRHHDRRHHDDRRHDGRSRDDRSRDDRRYDDDYHYDNRRPRGNFYGAEDESRERSSLPRRQQGAAPKRPPPPPEPPAPAAKVMRYVDSDDSDDMPDMSRGPTSTGAPSSAAGGAPAEDVAFRVCKAVLQTANNAPKQPCPLALSSLGDHLLKCNRALHEEFGLQYNISTHTESGCCCKGAGGMSLAEMYHHGACPAARKPPGCLCTCGRALWPDVCMHDCVPLSARDTTTKSDGRQRIEAHKQLCLFIESVRPDIKKEK